MTRYRVAPFAGVLEDLPRYVNQELQRLSETLSDDAGAASLYVATPGAAKQIGTAFELIDDWDSLTPVRYLESCEPSIADGAIYLQNEGIWLVAFNISVDIQQNREYIVRLYVDGVPAELEAVVDPSNQTDVVHLSSVGSTRLDHTHGQRARKLELRVGASGGGADWQVLNAYFSVWRASD